MPTLTMTRGLPGSGKSTWAAQQVLAAPPGTVVRVTKDAFRAMLHAGRSKGRSTEDGVLAARDALVSLFLARGADVIVDDTNLDPRHEARLAALAGEAGAGFAVRDFTGVPLATCITRDLARPDSVGERKIRAMHQRYLAAAPAPYAAPPGAPSAILVDIDGTLAQMQGRSPFAWSEVGGDRPIATIIALVRDLAAAGEKVIYCTGRDGSCREQTQAWLAEHVGVPTELLLMKEPGDMRSDAVTKAEAFEAHIRGRYAVRLVLDDRARAVRTWRELGLTCLQVADGDF